MGEIKCNLRPTPLLPWVCFINLSNSQTNRLQNYRTSKLQHHLWQAHYTPRISEPRSLEAPGSICEAKRDKIPVHLPSFSFLVLEPTHIKFQRQEKKPGFIAITSQRARSNRGGKHCSVAAPQERCKALGRRSVACYSFPLIHKASILPAT